MKDLPELHERYEKNIQGQLSCFDRIILYGTFGKQDRVLRLETTTSNISFFKHRRKVVKHDGTIEMKTAAVKKTIHSLGVLRELMGACNRRYYEYISQLQDHTRAHRTLEDLSKPVSDSQGRSHRGINFFEINDLKFIQALVRGEYNISGFTNRLLQGHLRKLAKNKLNNRVFGMCCFLWKYRKVNWLPNITH